jgi:uncharacterized protein (TIGR03435 family)
MAGAAVLACSLAPGQTTDKALTFDAAVIKPFVPPTGGRGMIMLRGGRGGPGSTDPGRIHYPTMTVKDLLTIAYGVKDFQISGPPWLAEERFDIQATMPPQTTKEQFHIMLQNLLAERFKVTIHRETKELPMYSMVVAKNGPKMKESAPVSPEESKAEPKDAPPPPPLMSGPLKLGPDGFPILPMNFGGRGGFNMLMMNGRARFMAQQQTMHDLADRLSQQLSRPVTDATGLTAKYDFTLTFLPEGMMNTGKMLGPPPGAEGRGPSDAEVEAPPDIFTAMQSQLGLKLEPKKGPVDLIVVDHAEKTPTEN